jgi:hypothetical protein
MPQSLSPSEFVEQVLDFVTTTPRRDDAHVARLFVERLLPLDPYVVNRESQRHILRGIGAAWSRGWQPKELVRQVRRATDSSTAELSLTAIAVDHASRRATTLDGQWLSQLAQLELPTIAPNNAWFAAWASAAERTRHEQLRAVVALLQSLVRLAPIPTLIPPPGAPSRPDAINLTTKTHDPMLDRVRALLAQAESTQFEAEAETFTAKAHALMTRHAIDMAMVSAGSQRSERPDTIRIAIDEPYVDAKSFLLHVVAESSRCKAVLHERYAMVSLVGFAADLDATETLYTSLLIQAQTAMHSAASTAPPGTRTRSRGFRSAFLTAYAQRVAERLDEINNSVVADVASRTGQAILPVLAARSAKVDSTVNDAFGQLRTADVRRRFDTAGWESGRRAADRARLNAGDLDPATPANVGTTALAAAYARS